jgi:hypothetical protein
MEEGEAGEIPVACVEPADVVLLEDRGDVGVGHEVSAGRDVAGQIPVDLPESFGLADASYVRPREEAIDVSLRFGGGKGLGEDPWVGRDPQVAHHGWPGEIADLVAEADRSQKVERPGMECRRSVWA